MGILDASVVFFLPLGIDFVVIIMSARKPDLFWLYALLATVGSVAGAAGTFWLGRKVGEAGLKRLVRPSTLKKVEQRVTQRSGVERRGARPHPPALSVHSIRPRQRRRPCEPVDVSHDARRRAASTVRDRSRARRVLRPRHSVVDAIPHIYSSRVSTYRPGNHRNDRLRDRPLSQRPQR